MTSFSPADKRQGDSRLRNDWAVIRSLAPYLWEFKWRVAVALTFLATAKLANVGVPLVMKRIVDSLDSKHAVIALPLALLAASDVHDPVRRAARCGVRACRQASNPTGGPASVSSLALALLAFSLGTSDRRPHARHRTRYARYLHIAQLHAVFDYPGHSRIQFGRSRVALSLRLALRGSHLRGGGDLHGIHHYCHRMADGFSSQVERARLESQHTGHRQFAELRNGQVLQQRGVGGAALRRELAASRIRRGQKRGFARRAQHRTERDHRGGGDPADDFGCGRRREPDPHAWGSRPRELLAHSTLHPA